LSGTENWAEHARQHTGREKRIPFYARGDVRIHYEEAGSGFRLLLIPGGGLNSTIPFVTDKGPFNAIDEFNDEYRCVAEDLRNANGGQSTGPLEIDRPWDAYTDDHIGLIDHLGTRDFRVMDPFGRMRRR
jgi:pimeloyl-ACP methyl ester carboxylesterase